MKTKMPKYNPLPVYKMYDKIAEWFGHTDMNLSMVKKKKWNKREDEQCYVISLVLECAENFWCKFLCSVS